MTKRTKSDKYSDKFYIQPQSKYKESHVWTKKELEANLGFGELDPGTMIYEVTVSKKFKVKVPALEAQLIEVK